MKEAESLSPLALGFSMIIDYKTRKITFGKQLPAGAVRLRAAAAAAPAGDRARHGRRQASGELRRRYRRGSDLDQHGHGHRASGHGPARARSADRAEGLRLVGLGQGRVPDAGRRSLVRHDQYTNFPVVVLNLDTPSALLGFQLGGIVGHRFLSKYRVGIDLERSVLRLKAIPEQRLSRRRCQLSAARFFLSRSARRACASAHTRRSSSVSTSSGATGMRPPSASIVTNVRNARLVCSRVPVRISSE